MNAVYDSETRLTILDMPPESLIPSGRYYMRGAICWPIEITDISGTVAEGVLLVAGMNVQNNVLYVFADHKFRCIDNLLDASRRIVHRGVAPEFNRAWSDYYLSHYYWSQDNFAYSTYATQVYRSHQIVPKPHFISVQQPTTPGAAAISSGVLYERIQTDRLKYPRNSVSHQAMSDIRTDSPSPGVIALRALVLGHAKYPWRES